jgi:hypothetical protein
MFRFISGWRPRMKHQSRFGTRNSFHAGRTIDARRQAVVGCSPKGHTHTHNSYMMISGTYIPMKHTFSSTHIQYSVSIVHVKICLHLHSALASHTWKGGTPAWCLAANIYLEALDDGIDAPLDDSGGTDHHTTRITFHSSTLPFPWLP